MIRHSEFLKKKKKSRRFRWKWTVEFRQQKASGCDAYLTGDVKYHDFFQSENQMIICDIGHFESEQFVTEQLVEILSEKFPTFAFSKSTEKNQPCKLFLLRYGKKTTVEISVEEN